jgi:hypothetical protein
MPARQFEPDITLNARALKATWFVEWDSYYDLIPDRFAQTMKTGVGERVGRDRRWVVSAYYSTAINKRVWPAEPIPVQRRVRRHMVSAQIPIGFL